MTISTPVSAIMDGRNALLAVGMNGQPLPVAHGFPARMVVPGLYGYTSATKWVTKLEVTTFAAQRAYWTQRGYAAVAPIRTESRIDVPKPLAQVKAGRVPVAGVAWAPHRGIRAVQVSVERRPVAGGPAGQRRRHRHLAAVGVGLGRHPGAAPAPGARDRRLRSDADHPPYGRVPQRRHRPGLGGGDRDLISAGPASGHRT